MADVENVGGELSFEAAQAEWLARNNPTSSEETAESADDAARDDDHAGDEDADATADKSAKSDDHAKDEQDEESDDEGDKGHPGKKKGGFQRRIEKLNAKIAERDRQIAELAAKTAGAKTDAPETKPTADAADPEPEAKDDESAAEFLKRYAKWQVRQDLKAERAATEKAATDAKAKDALEAAQKTWNEREAIAKEQFADEEKDYEESTTDFIKRAQAGKVAVSQVMKDFVNDSEFGPQMLYAIANLPDAEVNKIAAMGTSKAAAALTALEAQFAPKKSAEQSATEDKKPPVTTKAPPPVKPVTRPSPSARTFDPNDEAAAKSMSADEWARKRNAEQRKKGRLY